VWAKAVEAVTLPTTACFWLCHGQKKSERRTTAKLGEGSFDSSFRSALVVVEFDDGGGVGVSAVNCVGTSFGSRSMPRWRQRLAEWSGVRGLR